MGTSRRKLGIATRRQTDYCTKSFSISSEHRLLPFDTDRNFCQKRGQAENQNCVAAKDMNGLARLYNLNVNQPVAHR